MATLTKVADDGSNVSGWYRTNTFAIVAGTNVAVGGEAITAAAVGLKSIVRLEVGQLGDANPSLNIRWGRYDYTNGKLQYFSAAGTEVTGDLSAYSGRLTVYGHG